MSLPLQHAPPSQHAPPLQHASLQHAPLQPAHQLLRLAGRIFNTPLMIQRDKMDVILHVLGPRLNLAEMPIVESSAMEVDRGDRKPYEMTKDGIAVVDISGTLVKKASWLDSMSGITSYEQLEAEICGALSDDACKGVLMVIDSPGGEVGGLFDLADRINALKSNKPLYSAVSDMACSAAYAIASCADANKLFVTQTGGVGSIGVFALHVDQSKLDEGIGLKYTYVYAGDGKVDGNPHEPLTQSAYDEMKSEIDRTYDMFVNIVSTNRNMSAAKIREMGARVKWGSNAISVRLADQVGTPERAMEVMRRALAQRKSQSTSSAQFAHDKVTATYIPSQEIPPQEIPPQETTEDIPELITEFKGEAQLLKGEAQLAAELVIEHFKAQGMIQGMIGAAVQTSQAQPDQVQSDQAQYATTTTLAADSAASPISPVINERTSNMEINERTNHMENVENADVDAQAAAIAADKDCPEDMKSKGKKKGDDDYMAAPKKDDSKNDNDDDDKDMKAFKEIEYLCNLAGFPKMAADFILGNASVTEVRSRLKAARGAADKAESGAAGDISHHTSAMPQSIPQSAAGTGSTGGAGVMDVMINMANHFAKINAVGSTQVGQLEQMARSRAAASGLSYSKAYEAVLKENPGLYAQYLQQKDAAFGRLNPNATGI